MRLKKTFLAAFTILFLSVCAIALAVLYLVSRDFSVRAPDRIRGVPDEAVWAGGPDGGSWFLCKDSQMGPSYYDCEVYNDFDASFVTRGSYVLRSYTWDDNEKREVHEEVKSVKELKFNYYDGYIITLLDSLLLLPDGLIDHSFGDGHGKRQMYDLGEPVGPVQPY